MDVKGKTTGTRHKLGEGVRNSFSGAGKGLQSRDDPSDSGLAPRERCRKVARTVTADQQRGWF